MSVAGVGEKWADYILKLKSHDFSGPAARELCVDSPGADNVDWSSIDWSNPRKLK